LLQAAACHRDLRLIDVQNNRVGGVGLKNISRAMERNRYFSVNISGNEIGDEGTEHLIGAYKRFGGKGSHSILNLCRNDICKNGAEHVGQLLKNNDFVSELNLAFNTLGAKGVEYLVRHIATPTSCVLRNLNLQSNCLGDEGAEEVSKIVALNIPTLLKLNINNNEITDKGAVHVARAMEKNTTLQTLLMSHNSVGANTVAVLVDIIRNSKILKQIDLKRNGLADELKNRLSDAQKASQSQGFRLDYGAMDDAVPVEDFKTKLREFAETIKAKEAAAKDKAKKKKKE